MRSLFLVLFATAANAASLLHPHGAVYSHTVPTAQVTEVKSVHQPPAYTVVREQAVQPAPVVHERVDYPVQKNVHFADVNRVVGSTQQILKTNLSPLAPGAHVYNRGAPHVPDTTVVQEHQVAVPNPVVRTVVEPVVQTHNVHHQKTVIEQPAPIVQTHAVHAGPVLAARTYAGGPVYATGALATAPVYGAAVAGAPVYGALAGAPLAAGGYAYAL